MPGWCSGAPGRTSVAPLMYCGCLHDTVREAALAERIHDFSEQAEKRIGGHGGHQEMRAGRWPVGGQCEHLLTCPDKSAYALSHHQGGAASPDSSAGQRPPRLSIPLQPDCQPLHTFFRRNERPVVQVADRARHVEPVRCGELGSDKSRHRRLTMKT